MIFYLMYVKEEVAYNNVQHWLFVKIKTLECMGARSKQHPRGQVARSHRRCKAGGERTPLPIESGYSSLRTSRGNPFGPQSQWSSLLWEREYLQDEIVRGEKYLRQLHRDIEAGCLFWETWNPNEPTPSGLPYTVAATSIGITDTLERSLQDWLERLQKRLEAVSKDIEVMPTHRALAPQSLEESVFTLLRAAG